MSPLKPETTLRSRRGEGMLTFLIVFLPIAVILLSMAVDGMGAAAAYRRALALSSIAARAGAATLSYTGGGAAVAGQNACAAAIQTLCENLSGGCAALHDGRAQASCIPSSTGVSVRVGLRPMRMLYGPFSVAPDMVSAQTFAAAASGIDLQD